MPRHEVRLEFVCDHAFVDYAAATEIEVWPLKVTLEVVAKAHGQARVCLHLVALDDKSELEDQT
jgi:hypothetical protein